MLPSLVEFSQYTSQIASVTSKELNHADSLCDKALNQLKTCEKNDIKDLLVNFTAAFFKLFMSSAPSMAEGLTKKFLSLLKEIQQLRSNQKQKYDYLILGLLEFIDKFNIEHYYQSESNSQKNEGYLKQEWLSWGPKGGNCLKELINLVKKAVERQKEWSSRVANLTECLFKNYEDQINAFLGKQESDSEKKRPLLKLLTIQDFIEILKIKFDKQITTILQEYLLNFVETQRQPNKKEIVGLILLIQLKEDKINLDLVRRSVRQFNFQTRNFDMVLAYALLRELLQLKEGCGSIKCLEKLIYLYYWATGQDIELETVNDKDLAVLILKLTLRIHFSKNDYVNGPSFKDLVSVFTLKVGEQMHKYKIFQHFEQQKYNFLRQVDQGKEDIAIAMALLCWTISTFDVKQQMVEYQSERFLLKNIKIALSQADPSTIMRSQSFWRSLYIGFSFRLPFFIFMQELFEAKVEKKDHLEVLKQIYEKMPSNNKDFDNQMIFRLKTLLKQNKITLEVFIEFLTKIFQNDELPIFFQQIQSTFSHLSEVLYQKLNIRSATKEQPTKQKCSFETHYQKTSVKKALSFLRLFYEREEEIEFKIERKWISNDPIQTEKIIVIALRKYLNIHYGKISQVLIRKWILSREYVNLWVMLLCGYKVKTICENLIRCNVEESELLKLFKVQPIVVKHFVEYLATKDKYKFRLQLYHNQRVDQVYLLETPIPTLLLKTLDA